MINNTIVKEKKKINIFTGNSLFIVLIILPILIVSFIIGYFTLSKNYKYVYNNNNSFNIHCYSNSIITTDGSWNIIYDVNIGDKIVCNISYEVPYNLKNLSYSLDYGNSLKIKSIGKYWGNKSDLDANLTVDDNLFTYNYTKNVSFDDSPNITFEVINDDVKELFIKVKNIKYTTFDNDNYKEDDIYYLFDIKDNSESNYSDYGNKLNNLSLIYRIKNHKLATFDILDSLIGNKYNCDSKNINDDASVSIKNCNINGEIVSHDNKNNNSFIYVYKSNGSYFISKEKKYENNYSLTDYYVCKSSFCEGIIENDFVVISDLELMYKKIGSNNKFETLYSKNEYDIKKIDNENNLYVRYYEINGLPLYVYFLYNDNEIMSYQYIEFEFNNSLRVNLLGNYLSFNLKTLENGYILMDNYEDSKRNIYIYDYINMKNVFDVSDIKELSNTPKFTKNDNYAIFDDETSYQTVLYLNKEMNIWYDGIIYKDDNYYEFSNKNILFKRENKYYIYDINGKFVKEIFKNINPNYIEINDEKVYGLVYQDKNFKVYDENSNNTFTSHNFKDIYGIYKNHEKIYIIVNENGYLKLFDKDGNVIITFMEMTDNLEFLYNYFDDIWLRDKNVPLNEMGAYILCYYDYNLDTLYVSKMDYEGGY